MTLLESLDCAMGLVREELGRQFEKWGRQDHGSQLWLVILGEEYGELCQSVLHDQFGGHTKGTAEKEAVQIAAVAVQMIATMIRDKFNGAEVVR